MGDYNGDGQRDFAILRELREFDPLYPGSADSVDSEVHLFYGLRHLSGDVEMEDSDQSILSDPQTGVITNISGTDLKLNNDQFDDLILFVPEADYVGDSVVMAAGKGFVVYGGPTLYQLPTEFELLNNTSLGPYLIEDEVGFSVEGVIPSRRETETWLPFRNAG